MKFFQVQTETTHDCADAVSEILIECGSSGTAVYDKQDLLDLQKNGRSWDYVEQELLDADGSAVRVLGFYDCESVLEQIRERLNALRSVYHDACGSLQSVGVWLDEADYANEWKKYYLPILIDKVAIVPEWLDRVKGYKNIFLDPGPAFGMGSHATTSMCVKLLQRVAVKNASVFDLGCGSGILGITALKLGAAHCVFADIDEMALSVARRNAERNECTKDSKFLSGDIKTFEPFACDVLIANITADILLMLGGEFHRFLKPGGRLILSGIIDSECRRVLDGFTKMGFCIKTHLEEKEWHAVMAEAEYEA